MRQSSYRHRFKRKINFMVKLAIVCNGLLFCLWLSRNIFVDILLENALEFAEKKAKGIGVELVNLDSGMVDVSAGCEVRVPNVVANFDLHEKNAASCVRASKLVN